MGVDRALLEAIASHRTSWITDLANTVMVVGMSRLTYLAAFVLCVIFAWLFRAWLPAAAALVASMVAVGIADVGKDLIARPRPPQSLSLVHTGGFAMPSSIAAMTAAAATPVIILGLRRATRAGRLLAAALIAATFFVGVSMIYLGAHWLSDVLAGWPLGVAVGVGILFLFELPSRWKARAAR